MIPSDTRSLKCCQIECIIACHLINWDNKLKNCYVALKIIHLQQYLNYIAFEFSNIYKRLDNILNIIMLYRLATDSISSDLYSCNFCHGIFTARLLSLNIYEHSAH